MENVLVTGASGGIGTALCVAFAQTGRSVAVHYRNNRQHAENLAKVLSDTYRVKTIAVQADVADRQSVNAMLDAVSAQLGDIDILVNNAGVWEHRDVIGRQRFEDMPIEEIKRLVDINFYGVVHCLQAVIPHMAERKYGRIVNLGSIAGEVGLPGYADYAACKAAVIELTETLAMENAKRGITVNSVSPGMILKSVGPHDGTWVGWSGSPDDIARAIVFLASDTAAYMTGVDMPVDGGRILGPHNCDM